MENEVDCSSIPVRRALHSYQPAFANWTSSMVKPFLGSNAHELDDEDTSIWTGQDKQWPSQHKKKADKQTKNDDEKEEGLNLPLRYRVRASFLPLDYSACMESLHAPIESPKL